ncbi:MAG TPA: prephenate dehydrogenase/arogenate dehydrogenase family protein [Terracidiphilus sp.]|jgi:prephenate dehydrogenase|nr:prephenate dehydrogenase/arogenate dehydrogenase family protein [Terracidiphilus sp.]
MIERIAIVGTGLLGASAGLALRAAGFSGSIAGWNRGAEQGQIALEMGAIDSVAKDPIEMARESQVVVLATPVFAILDWMEKLAGVLGPGYLITDVGSTKGQITDAADRLFNRAESAGFLPGHPMAGKERGGAALGDATLFHGAVWLFTDKPDWKRSSQSDALAQSWRGWVGAMGSKIIDLDATRHDELVAWVSHLPQFVATAMSALLEDAVGEAPELKDVGGRGLREMTRLGASPFSMWRDIAHTNSKAVEASIFALEQRLAHLRENLRTPELRDEFDKANRFRRN